MAKDAEGHEGVWRTIRGRRVFIKDGEDLESAMRNSGKFEWMKKEQESALHSYREIKKEKERTHKQYDEEFAEARRLGREDLEEQARKKKYERLAELQKVEDEEKQYYKDRISKGPDLGAYPEAYRQYEKDWENTQNFNDDIYLREEFKLSKQEYPDEQDYLPGGKKWNKEWESARQFSLSEDNLDRLKQGIEASSKIPDAYNDSMITSRNDDEVIKDLNQRKELLYTHKDRYTQEEYKKQEDGLNAGIEYAKTRQEKAREIDKFNNDINPMEEWSDTVGDGYSDAQRKAIKTGNVTLPDGTPIDQNYVKDLYSGMSYEEVKRENDFDKEWMKDVKPEAKAMQMAKVEETDKYLASMERYESRISDEEYGKKDWGDGVYPFSEGTAWKGTKSGERLSTKEIAKAVTDKMKEAYPGVKIGRNTSYYSGGSSADFYITSSDKPIVRDISDFSQTEISRLYNKGYNSNYYHTEDEFKASIEKELTSGHFNINPYYIDDDYRLTPYGKQVVKDLRKVSDAYNYDESDGMTDYFNTGFYSDISIGRYNKPFVQGKQAKSNVKAKIDRYKERKGSSSNTMTKRQLAEKIVENQIERGVITGRNKEAIIKDKMKNFSKEDLLKYFE